MNATAEIKTGAVLFMTLSCRRLRSAQRKRRVSGDLSVSVFFEGIEVSGYMKDKLQYLKYTATEDTWYSRFFIGSALAIACVFIFYSLFRSIAPRVMCFFLVMAAYVFESLSRDIQIEIAKKDNLLVNRGSLKFSGFFAFFPLENFGRRVINRSKYKREFLLAGQLFFIQFVLMIFFTLSMVFT